VEGRKRREEGNDGKRMEGHLSNSNLKREARKKIKGCRI
jgi:hypothetical protein